MFFTLPLAFLTLPARRGIARPAVPWLDVALAVIAALAIGYLTLHYPRLVLMIFARPAEIWIPGIVVVLVLLEALRRATGWALVLIIAAFLLYALFGDIFPGRLQGRPQNWQLLAGYMAVDSNGNLGPRAVGCIDCRGRLYPVWRAFGHHRRVAVFSPMPP